MRVQKFIILKITFQKYKLVISNMFFVRDLSVNLLLKISQSLKKQAQFEMTSIRIGLSI